MVDAAVFENVPVTDSESAYALFIRPITATMLAIPSWTVFLVVENFQEEAGARCSLRRVPAAPSPLFELDQ